MNDIFFIRSAKVVQGSAREKEKEKVNMEKVVLKGFYI